MALGKRRSAAVVVGAAVSLLAVGCGAKTGLKIPEPGPPDASVPPVDASLDAPPDALPDAFVEPPTCTVFGATAELLPLDVFMLFDSSGSMHEPTPTGTGTKWEAVRRAIRSFFRDPDSRGIGVGVTFFPLVREGVPALCEDDTACMSPGACAPASACLEAGVLCNTSTDCAVRGFPRDTCTAVGFCPALGMEGLCTLDGAFPCPAGTGPCMPIGVCENRDTCEPEAYETPDVGIELLPDASGRLLRSYDRHALPRDEAGGTPTLPAVTGVVTAALRRSREEPTHKIVVVVATDGFPTSCDPDLRTSLEAGILNIANQVRRGVDEADVETFVVGVFGPSERAFAQMNLDRIAVAGGTETAFIVNTATGVTNEFLEALNQVRLDATACDFALSEPVPVTGDPIFARITRDGREVWIPQVADATECAAGGFFFPDTPGGSIVRIALCPITCSLLGASPDRELELFTVCSDDPTER